MNLNPKKVDKFMVGLIYLFSGTIILILASLLLFILWRGLPQFSWEFLTAPAKSFPVGGGI